MVVIALKNDKKKKTFSERFFFLFNRKLLTLGLAKLYSEVIPIFKVPF